MLNLKIYRQSLGLCGPASLKMVLDYYGLKKSESELAKLIGASKSGGCTPEQIMAFLNKIQIKAKHKINSSISELKVLIKNKTPPIIYWLPVKGYGHYSVLTGIDSENVFIADPRKLNIMKIPISEFLKRWRDEFGAGGDKHEIIILENINTKREYRKAVFIAVYRFNKKTNQREYILLKRKKHWIGWEFPKGGIEKGERETDAAKRECHEETGLKARKTRSFNVRGKYRYDRELKDRPGFIGQTYSLFSAEVGVGKIKLDKKEHSGFMWTDFKTAMKKLTHQNQRRCLAVVERSLTQN